MAQRESADRSNDGKRSLLPPPLPLPLSASASCSVVQCMRDAVVGIASDNGDDESSEESTAKDDDDDDDDDDEDDDDDTDADANATAAANFGGSGVTSSKKTYCHGDEIGEWCMSRFQLPPPPPAAAPAANDNRRSLAWRSRLLGGT